MEAAGKTSLFFTPRNTPLARPLAGTAIRSGSSRKRQRPRCGVQRLDDPTIRIATTLTQRQFGVVVTPCAPSGPGVVGAMLVHAHVLVVSLPCL